MSTVVADTVVADTVVADTVVADTVAADTVVADTIFTTTESAEASAGSPPPYIRQNTFDHITAAATVLAESTTRQDIMAESMTRQGLDTIEEESPAAPLAGEHDVSFNEGHAQDVVDPVFAIVDRLAGDEKVEHIPADPTTGQREMWYIGVTHGWWYRSEGKCNGNTQNFPGVWFPAKKVDWNADLTRAERIYPHEHGGRMGMDYQWARNLVRSAQKNHKNLFAMPQKDEKYPEYNWIGDDFSIFFLSRFETFEQVLISRAMGGWGCPLPDAALLQEAIENYDENFSPDLLEQVMRPDPVVQEKIERNNMYHDIIYQMMRASHWQNLVSVVEAAEKRLHRAILTTTGQA